MRSRKDELPVFIQALYGTVAGLGFYSITAQNPGTLHIVNSWEAFLDFLTSATFCRFLFFCCTLMMLVHDWLGFQRLNKIKHPGYWHYVPLLLAPFCLSQMFRATELLNLNAWYAFAFGYTCSNLLSFALWNRGTDKTRTAVRYLKYLVQLFVTEIFFFTIPAGFNALAYLLALAITAYVFILLWWIESELRPG